MEAGWVCGARLYQSPAPTDLVANFAAAAHEAFGDGEQRLAVHLQRLRVLFVQPREGLERGDGEKGGMGEMKLEQGLTPPSR